MFFKKENIDNFRELIAEVKRYLTLQKEYAKIEMAEKLSIIVSTLVMCMVFILIGAIALLYFSFALAYFMAQYVGGLAVSLSIMGGILLFLILIIYILRKRIIINPLVNFLARLFLNDSNK